MMGNVKKPHTAQKETAKLLQRLKQAKLTRSASGSGDIAAMFMAKGASRGRASERRRSSSSSSSSAVRVEGWTAAAPVATSAKAQRRDVFAPAPTSTVAAPKVRRARGPRALTPRARASTPPRAATHVADVALPPVAVEAVAEKHIKDGEDNDADESDDGWANFPSADGEEGSGDGGDDAGSARGGASSSTTGTGDGSAE